MAPLLLPELTGLFVFLSKEPDKYHPGQREYQNPHYFSARPASGVVLHLTIIAEYGPPPDVDLTNCCLFY
jgi:hypothetical protein